VPGAGTHALLTRSPLGEEPKPSTPFDLHVLGAPPAFVLSQDQTLSFILFPTGNRPDPRAAVACTTPARKSDRPAGGPTASRARSPRTPSPSKPLKGRPVPRPPARRPASRQTATRPTRKPASTQDAQDQRPTSRRPRIPSSLPLCPKNEVRRQTAAPCRARGRGFIVTATAGHKSFFRRFLAVNPDAQKYSPRLRIS
jgi:hypothetical protein